MKRIYETEDREPFRVPDGYFETLSDRILNNVQNKDISLTDKKAEKTIIMRLRPVLYIAAALCGIAVITYSVFKFSHGNTVNTESQSVVADAMIEEIDTYTLESEIISSSQVKAIDNDSFSESLMLENIDDTDITTDNK